MKFALLGEDPHIAGFVRAIDVAPGHQLVAAAFCPSLTAELSSKTPGVPIRNRWEDLLVEQGIDAVVVAGSDENVLTGARHLAGAGTAVLLSLSAGQGSTFVYELTLIRDDTHVVLFPLIRSEVDPRISQLVDLIRNGQVGQVVDLQFSRDIAGRSDASGKLLSVSELDEHLLNDIGLLRRVGGRYDQVTALRSGPAENRISQANVSLAGEGLPQAVWSIRTDANQSKWELSVTAEQGRFVLAEMENRVVLEQVADSGTRELAAPKDVSDTDTLLLRRFEHAMRGEAVSPDWTSAVHLFETVDATHRSIKRRRTIDLHFETTSERSIFKTQMTAIGCGLLLLTLFGLIALLTLGALLDSQRAEVAGSESAGFVMRTSEFEAGSANLNQTGISHVADMARRVPGVSLPIYVERSQGDDNLDNSRRNSVVESLVTHGIADAEQRTFLAPETSELTNIVMKIARIAWLVPLVLFLLLQLLVFVAKPSAAAQSSRANASQESADQQC